MEHYTQLLSHISVIPVILAHFIITVNIIIYPAMAIHMINIKAFIMLDHPTLVRMIHIKVSIHQRLTIIKSFDRMDTLIWFQDKSKLILLTLIETFNTKRLALNSIFI